jgi:hypothetical protein
LSTKPAPKIRLKLKTMNPRQWVLVTMIALAAVAFGIGVMFGLNRLLTRPTLDPVVVSPSTPAAGAATAAVPRIKATLYFQAEDGLHLVASEREIPLAEGAVAQARSILEAQLSAEPSPPLASTIPKGTVLRGIFVSDRNEVFVDLDPAIRKAHPGGTLQELMTVYTIVNAVLTNLPNLTEVQILIGGQEADTLAGHVDLRRPLRKNEALIQQ